MITTIHWVNYRTFHDDKVLNECKLCRHQEHCGYVGSEGELMHEDVVDTLSWPIVLACSGWMPVQKVAEAGPISTLSPRQSEEVRGELHKVRQERYDREDRA